MQQAFRLQIRVALLQVFEGFNFKPQIRTGEKSMHCIQFVATYSFAFYDFASPFQGSSNGFKLWIYSVDCSFKPVQIVGCNKIGIGQFFKMLRFIIPLDVCHPSPPVCR